MDIRLAQWLSSHDTGASSKAIALHMSSGFCDGSHPHDPADLGRCLRLLEKFPEWKPRIREMAMYSGEWRVLSEHWEKLAQSMADEVGIDWSKGRRAEKTYALMRKCRDEDLRSDPNVEILREHNGEITCWVRKRA